MYLDVEHSKQEVHVGAQRGPVHAGQLDDAKLVVQGSHDLRAPALGRCRDELIKYYLVLRSNIVGDFTVLHLWQTVEHGMHGCEVGVGD